MKYILYSLAILLATSSWAQAQDKAERIKALKVAFITKELNLTSEESAQFWPIYNEWEAEKKAIRKEVRNGKKDLDAMSDAEIQAWINTRFDAEERQLKLKRTYSEKIKGIIGVRRLAKLGMAERKFKQALLKRVQERRRR